MVRGERKLEYKQEGSVYKIRFKVTVTDNEGNLVTELIEDKYVTSEMLEALRRIKE